MLQPDAARQKDAWIASADASGDAHLVPMTYYWDGRCLVFATGGGSRTARNLRRAGRVRLALGETRDVVMVEGPVQFVASADVDPELASSHATYAGFDAREEEGYVYMIVTPTAIQAWREVNEIEGRDVMKDGVWLA